MRGLGWSASFVAFACSACALLTDFDSLSEPVPAADPSEPAVGSSCGAGGVCVVSPPPGWSFVAARLAEGGDCPAGFAIGRDLVQLPASAPPATCACACGSATGVASCMGAGNVLGGRGSSESTCVGVVNVSASGSCSPLALTPIDYLRFEPVRPEKRPCASTVTTERPPIAPPPARVCTLSVPATDDGCSSERRCVPRPASPYSLCVTTAGDAPCPPAFPNRVLAGTSVRDGRGCSECACTTNDTCKNPRVELFSSRGCAGSPSKIVPANAACKAVGGSTTYSSGRYVAEPTPGGDCKVTEAPKPSGTVALEDPRVVCCP